MREGRTPFIVSVIIAAASLAAAVWYGEGMTIGVSLVALLIAIPALFRCGPGAARISLVAASSALISAVLMILLFPSDAFVIGIETDNNQVILSAVVHGMALIPQIVLLFFTMAAAFNMSLNWVMISGLGWMVGMGLSVSKYVAVLILQNAEVEADLVMNSTIVIGMLVNLVMFIIFFYALGRKFKKNRYLITSDGLEAME